MTEIILNRNWKLEFFTRYHSEWETSIDKKLSTRSRNFIITNAVRVCKIANAVKSIFNCQLRGRISVTKMVAWRHGSCKYGTSILTVITVCNSVSNESERDVPFVQWF